MSGRPVRGLYFCCICAVCGCEDAPKLNRGGFAVASSARETPARAMNRPIRTRRLKNADCEVDFFFISGVGYEVDAVDGVNGV